MIAWHVESIICVLACSLLLYQFPAGRNLVEQRGYDRGYEAGDLDGYMTAMGDFTEAVREGKVYLGPVTIWKEGGEMHHCIFICLDPNQVVVTLQGDSVTVRQCYFDAIEFDETGTVTMTLKDLQSPMDLLGDDRRIYREDRP